MGKTVLVKEAKCAPCILVSKKSLQVHFYHFDRKDVFLKKSFKISVFDFFTNIGRYHIRKNIKKKIGKQLFDIMQEIFDLGMKDKDNPKRKINSKIKSIEICRKMWVVEKKKSCQWEKIEPTIIAILKKIYNGAEVKVF